MSKNKYYAVKLGRNPGIYQTWGEVEEQVKGFSKPIYRSFNSLEKATNFMEDELNTSEQSSELQEKINEEIENNDNSSVISFVAGSQGSKENNELYSFASIIFSDNEKYTLHNSHKNTYGDSFKSFIGEIKATQESILWAIGNKKSKIKIYYKYEGVKNWATGEWKTKNILAKDYKNFFDSKKEDINISFERVSPEDCIDYSESAIELAKQAFVKKGFRTYNNGSIYITGYDINDWNNILEELPCILDYKYKNLHLAHSNPKNYMERIDISCNNDKVVICCYKGKKSYLQGKTSPLFRDLITLATENLNNEEKVFEVLNGYHALSIKEDQVITKLCSLMPNLPADLKDRKLYNSLLSAVFNTLLIGYMPDYTCLITPVCRIMEYYLHRILGDRLGHETSEKGHYNNKNKFKYFKIDKQTNLYVYKYSTIVLNQTQLEFLNELYNMYNRIRHGYFHWSQNSMDTAVITNMEEVHDKTEKILKFIDKYYIIY